MSKRRQSRICPKLDGHHYFFGRGMISDDTEHACLTAQAVIAAGGDAQRFARVLAWRLRFWLLGLPASVGFATLRALIKLWLGFPPHRSGVFSAGNGPAMRGALLGVCYGGDPKRLRDFVRASSRLTHTDPKAEWGAYAVALAAYLASQGREVAPQDFCAALGEQLPEAKELHDLIRRSAENAGRSAEEFAVDLGLDGGVSGYTLHTVPVALHAWLRHQTDYRQAVLSAIRCGGDTDSVAAIAGGIVGARAGRAGIPAAWIDGLWEWPRNAGWMTRLAERTAAAVSSRRPEQMAPVFWPGIFFRNGIFLAVMLGHGVRRLLPPY
jgi:ADP-ribosylglycohydrolase